MKDRIRENYYKGNLPTPKASTVAQLKKLLEELPDELPLGYFEDTHIYLVVYNINDNAHLIFEEDDTR